MANGNDLEWLAEQLTQLAHLAIQLTGNRLAANQLLLRTATEATQQGARLRGNDYLEANLRTILVRRFLAERSQPGQGIAPPELAELSHPQRAALILKHRTQLSLAEIASTMDSPLQRVTTDLDSALRVVDRSVDFDLGEALDELESQAPDSARVLTRIPAQLHKQRNRRTRWLACIAVAMAVIVAIPIYVVTRASRPSTAALIPGRWQLVHETNPPEQWVRQSTNVGENIQTTDFIRTIAGSDDADRCTVAVVAGLNPGTTPDETRHTPVEINHRPGFYSRLADLSNPYWRPEGPYLVWEYGENLWAGVSCYQNEDLLVPDDRKESLIELAKATKFELKPIMLPFKVREVPPGITDSYLTLGSEPTDRGMILLSQTGDGIEITSGPLDYRVLSDTTRLTVKGFPARMSIVEAAICLEQDPYELCIGVLRFDDAESSAAGIEQQLRELVDQVTPAPKIDDESSWFDAQESFG